MTATASAVEILARCRRPPVISARRMSRSTIITSASGGLPDEAKPRRHLAAGHVAARQGRLLRQMDDQRVEGLGVVERAAQHLGVADGMVGVGEGHGAGFGQQADLGQLLALQPDGQRAVGVHVHQLDLAGAAGHELDQRGVVERRLVVGQQHQRGDAARRARPRRRSPASPCAPRRARRYGRACRPGRARDRGRGSRSTGCRRARPRRTGWGRSRRSCRR